MLSLRGKTLGAAFTFVALAARSLVHAQASTASTASSAAQVQFAETPVSKGPAYVHIDAAPSVRLRRTGGRFGTTICDAPCDQVVEVSSEQTFYLEGEPSHLGGFALVPNRRNEISLEGDAGVSGFGLALTAVGGASLGVGGLVLGFHTIVNAFYDEDVPEGNIIAYSSMMGGGALLLAIGIPLLVAFEPELVVRQTDAVRVSIEPNGFAVKF